MKIAQHYMFDKDELDAFCAVLDEWLAGDAVSEFERDCNVPAEQYVLKWRDFFAQHETLTTSEINLFQQKAKLDVFRQIFNVPQDMGDAELAGVMRHWGEVWIALPYMDFLKEKGIGNGVGALNYTRYDQQREKLACEFQEIAEEKGLDAAQEIRKFARGMQALHLMGTETKLEEVINQYIDAQLVRDAALPKNKIIALPNTYEGLFKENGIDGPSAN
jgi:hypothetical protein